MNAGETKKNDFVRDTIIIFCKEYIWKGNMVNLCIQVLLNPRHLTKFYYACAFLELPALTVGQWYKIQIHISFGENERCVRLGNLQLRQGWCTLWWCQSMVGFKPLEMQSLWRNDSSKPTKLLAKGKDGPKGPKETWEQILWAQLRRLQLLANSLHSFLGLHAHE